jgi:hypothetical protein
MAEEILIPDTRPILIQYETLNASIVVMEERIQIPDTRPILINMTN